MNLLSLFRHALLALVVFLAAGEIGRYAARPTAPEKPRRTAAWRQELYDRARAEIDGQPAEWIDGGELDPANP